MYRERIRSCPACQAPMKEVAIIVPDGPVSVDMCETCGGVFLDYHDGEPSHLARALVASDAGAASAAGRAQVNDASACPDCARDLELMAYLVDGPPLYRCSGCMAAFVTREQLDQLAAYEQLEPHRPSFWRALWKKLV